VTFIALARFEGRIETNRHGHIILLPPPGYSHGSYQLEIGWLLAQLLPDGRAATESPIFLSKERWPLAVVGELMSETVNVRRPAAIAPCVGAHFAARFAFASSITRCSSSRGISA